MKILFCIPTLGHGGAERQLSYLAPGLSELGHEVHVASARGGPNLARLKSGEVVWHHLGGAGHRDPMIFFRLIRLLRKLRPDIVQTILTPMDIIGGMAALLTRTPWVLKECSSALLYARGWRNRLRLALGRRADAIVSNSTGGCDYWRQARVNRPLSIIPNAIPVDEITAAISDGAVDYTFGQSEKVVLYAGRLDSGKNVESLLDALVSLKNEMPVSAVICGDGPRRPHLEQLARELGIAHRLVFTGYIENLWALMKRVDALVSLSKFEGCPNVILEAMACGCPLIVSNIPAHREILDEHCALFANPHSPVEAAAALKATLFFREAAQRRAAAARERAAGRPIEATVLLYEQLYLNLLGAAYRELHARRISDDMSL